MPEITVFDEASLRKLARDHELLHRRVMALEQQNAVNRGGGDMVQPIIGKATGDAGTVTGTYKIAVQRGSYRNVADTGDGEVDHYSVYAKPWIGDSAPSEDDEVMLWRTPFGLWYFFAGSSLAYGGLALGATGLSLGAGTQIVPFNTAAATSGVTADTANNRLEVAAGGTYIIDWAGIIVESNNVAETAIFKIYKNGGDIGGTHWQAGTIQNTTQAWAFTSPPTELAAGDRISLYLTTAAASQMQTNGMNIRVVRIG